MKSRPNTLEHPTKNDQTTTMQQNVTTWGWNSGAELVSIQAKVAGIMTELSRELWEYSPEFF